MQFSQKYTVQHVGLFLITKIKLQKQLHLPPTSGASVLMLFSFFFFYCTLIQQSLQRIQEYKCLNVTAVIHENNHQTQHVTMHHTKEGFTCNFIHPYFHRVSHLLQNGEQFPSTWQMAQVDPCTPVTSNSPITKCLEILVSRLTRLTCIAIHKEESD